jgi:cyclopropane fatty-acyl-phospholipid synthase-like methyltransferase
MSLFDGISGWLAAKAMARMNADAEREAVMRLAPARSSRNLVIGFGPGIGLEYMLRQTDGEVVGVDPSMMMHREAGRRNATALRRGRLKLFLSGVESLDDDVGQFDGAIAVHTLQMCKPFSSTARRLSALMKPEARLVSITHAWAAKRDYGSAAAFCDTVEKELMEAGFRNVRCGKADAEKGSAILIEAQRADRPGPCTA